MLVCHLFELNDDPMWKSSRLWVFYVLKVAMKSIWYLGEGFVRLKFIDNIFELDDF